MATANDYFVPGLLALSGILSNRAETTKSTQTQTSSQSPAVAAFRKKLLEQYGGMIDGDDPTTGIVAQGLSDINRNYALRKQQLIENLAQRGITGFAADAAIQQLDNQRFAEITKARQTGTFQAAQFKQGLMAQAGSFAANEPTSVTSSGTQTTPGKPFAQGFSNVSDFIAHQYGQAYARNNPGLPSSIPGGTGPTSNGSQLPNYVGGLKALGSGLKKVFGKLF